MNDIPPAVGELLRSDDPVAFAAVIELMDSLGARFIVKLPDGLGADGPPLPGWCDEVIATWFDFIITAYAGVASGHHLYACTECCFPMLLTTARAGRRCPACAAVGGIKHRLPIHFVDPPARRKPAPKRAPEQEQTAPTDDETTPPPPTWPNCSHSLTSRQLDGTTHCAYCGQETTP